MRVSSPEDLNGAPQVEHKEDNGPVLHLLQTTEDHKQNHVPAGHLQHEMIDSIVMILGGGSPKLSHRSAVRLRWVAKPSLGGTD